MKFYLQGLLVLALFAGSSEKAMAADSVRVVRTCHLQTNPDSGVRVQILSFDDSGNGRLVAVVLSAGNTVPHVMGAYPVRLGGPNPGGYDIYSGTDFQLTFSDRTHFVALDTTTVHLSGTGPLFDCD